jgi:signal transduction histidine kinase/ABC-type amino acid transport substrate-binding protein
MDDDYPPYAFRAPDGGLKGILVDQWALWGKKTGIEVRLDAMDWAEAQRRMEKGDYDVIDTIFENEHRKTLFDFGPPYARLDVPLFFNRDLSGISGPRDLAGFIVGAKAGDNSIDILKAQGVSHFLLFPTYGEVVAAARDGKVKVFTVDQPPALYYLIRMGIQDQFKTTRPLYSGDFHRAVRKGRPDLLATVQRGFDLIGSAEYQAIDRKWRGTPLFNKGEIRRTIFIAAGALGILGLLLGWIWALRRMVARRTAELRAISNHFANGMFYQVRVDPAGNRKFTFLSESVPALYGVPVRAALADPSLIYRRIHPDDRAALAAAEAEAIRTVSPFSAEARVVGPDGRIRWSSYVSRPRKLAGGATIWDGVEFIITDRKRSEEALRESEAQFRSLISAIPDQIFTLNRAGDFLSVHTPSAERHQGRNLDEVLPQPLAGRFKRTIETALDANSLQQLDYSLVLAGEERFFEARMAPASMQQVIAIVRDVSKSRRLEDQQQRLQAQLQQAQKLDSLGSLAGGVAHDMNNVLGAILAIASANLECQPAGSTLFRAFDTVAKAATRGGQMVKNLLNFARQTPVQSQVVDLNTVIREVTQLLERTTLGTVQLVLELADGLRPMQGDPSALANSIMNLLVNAVDAMAGEGTLRLRTRNLEDHSIEVLVEDTGPGMSQEVLGKALDPFFTTKETGKGTGLGLSLVYGTVKAHQGQLEIQSEPVKGTRVTLRFPSRDPGHPAPATPEPAPAAPRPVLEVLLVDDDETMNASLQLLLNALGHQAVTTASGEAALAKIKGGYRPDLLFLDMNMPGLGGQGTLPRIRSLLPDLAVVLVTGKTDQAVLDLARAHPNVTLLPKPFSLEELRNHLATRVGVE